MDCVDCVFCIARILKSVRKTVKNCDIFSFEYSAELCSLKVQFPYKILPKKII